MRRLALAFALLCAVPAHATQVFLTSGTTWTVPADWNNGASTIECLGSGGDGATGTTNTRSGGGGGGGAYAKITNRAFPIGAVLTIQIAAHGSSNATFFKDNSSTTILSCDFGSSASGSTAGTGGGTNSIGDTKVSGGNGVGGVAVANRGGAGGGGSGGLVGGGGAAGAGPNNTAGGGGGGGGRSAASTSGSVGSATNGGNGGDGPAGTGHGVGGSTGVVPTNGTAGGGGGGGAPFVGDAVGGAGSCDTTWDSSHGICGGGAGGAGNATAVGAGGNAGTYGGGGGGGGDSASTAGAGGTGGSGIIVITYTPAGRSGASLGVGQ